MGADRHERRRRSRGGFVMVPYAMLESDAWEDLSGTAVKLLLLLMKLSKGNNGWGHKGETGELFLAEREAARALRIARNTASRCFDELIEHGFIRIVRAGHFKVKVRLATVWRLTSEPYPHAHQSPTNEWRHWEKKNPRAQNLKRTGSKIEHKSKDTAVTGARIEPVEIENRENPSVPMSSIIEPHLDIPRGVLARERDTAANSSDSTLQHFSVGGGSKRATEGG